MKVMLAQINTTPGNFSANYGFICTALREAQRIKNPYYVPDVIVFPELCIPGYLTQDLMYHEGYVEENLKYVAKVQSRSKECEQHLIVGYIDYNRKGSGKPFRNMAAVIHKGVIVATYAKQLLPFYDVFDEGRYFEPGLESCVIEMHGHKVGLCICEDVWNDKGSDDYNYSYNPVQVYRTLGCDTIISINSSPYVKGKAWKRVGS
jgi:predicted amidohydrolase